MTQSVNKVILLGILNGAVADFLTGERGHLIATFTVATTKRWVDPDNQAPRERTDLHQVEAVGKLAVWCRDMLTAGNEQVYIEGELETDYVERPEQPGKFDYCTVICASSVIRLGEQRATPKNPAADALDVQARVVAAPASPTDSAARPNPAPSPEVAAAPALVAGRAPAPARQASRPSTLAPAPAHAPAPAASAPAARATAPSQTPVATAPPAGTSHASKWRNRGRGVTAVS